MNDATAYYVRRYQLPLVETDGHPPDISVKATGNGQTVVVSCGCGNMSNRFTGCNEAGVCYAIHDGVEAYRKHVEPPKAPVGRKAGKRKGAGG